jgi:thiol-disulfide isomerase/thioredoxin
VELKQFCRQFELMADKETESLIEIGLGYEPVKRELNMDRRQFCWGLMGSGVALSLAAESAEAAPPFAASPVQKIRWNYSLKAAHRIAIEQDKPLLIVFGASWCTFCHKLERETLGDKRITAVIERDFIPVHLDFDRDAKVAKILEVERLPCTVILSPQADLLAKHEGYAQYKDYSQTLQTALQKQAEIQQVQAETFLVVKPLADDSTGPCRMISSTRIGSRCDCVKTSHFGFSAIRVEKCGGDLRAGLSAGSGDPRRTVRAN